MNLVCMSCYHEFEGSISYDELGWHSSCPECGCSFDVDLPGGEIIMAFADDTGDDSWENFTGDIRSASLLSYYAFSSRKEFLGKWEEKVYNEKPDSMWYWIIEGDNCITFGCPDPGDIELICEAWDLKDTNPIDIWGNLKYAYESCEVK